MAGITKVRGAVLDAFKIDVSSEIPITGATTLGSSAFGRMHVINLATDGTIVLPPVSGHAGKLIGIRIANACTKLVTLDANSSELIDGAATRVMWAGESAILLCDGVGWTKIAGKSIPMMCKLSANAVQSIPTGAYTTISLQNASINIGGMGDVAGNRIVIRRDGAYSIVAHMSMTDNIAYSYITDGSYYSSLATVALGGLIPPLSGYGNLAAGGILRLQCSHSTGANKNTYSSPYPFLSVTEIASW